MNLIYIKFKHKINQEKMTYQFIVTTDLNRLMEVANQRQIVMVDGTVPGFAPRNGDLHFDHHKEGGADIQLHELRYSEEIKENAVFVTTMVDADACVAAAALICGGDGINEAEVSRLEAISYDCDHLAVPERLSYLAGFAAKAVAAMKADSEPLIQKLSIPQDRKMWDSITKEKYASAAFEQGVMALVSAIRGEAKFPGESGEADEYFKKLETDIKDWQTNGKILQYRGCLIFDQCSLSGNYLDPRVPLRASSGLGLKPENPFTVTQRRIVDREGEFKGYSYTIGCNTLHEEIELVDLVASKTFERLTLAELKNNPTHFNDSVSNAAKINSELLVQYKELSARLDALAEWLCKPNVKLGWGGRKTVGGSSWNTPSKLSPQTIIDVILNSHVLQ